MSGYDGDISRLELYHLYLPMRSAGKSQQFRTKTAKTQRIIGCFKIGELGWLRRERMDMDAVLKDHDDARLGKPNAEYSGAELESDDCFLFGVVPNNDLVLRVFRLSPSTDKCQEVVPPQHFGDADAGIEVS